MYLLCDETPKCELQLTKVTFSKIREGSQEVKYVLYNKIPGMPYSSNYDINNHFLYGG